nr:hypothetical protein FVER53263_09374 [Fusarium verticillioides]
MVIIKWWGSTNAVDTKKLVFRHEFPVKRFCKMEKLREALGDIFGSNDWVVEYDGDNLIIKVGSRVDLKEELKARGIIYKSMCKARVVWFLRYFDPPRSLRRFLLAQHGPLHATIRDALPAAKPHQPVAQARCVSRKGFELPRALTPRSYKSTGTSGLPRRLLIPRSSPTPTIRRAYHDWPAITSVAVL